MLEDFDSPNLRRRAPRPPSFHLLALPDERVSTMKNKASTFIKQVFSVIANAVKAKSMAVRSKTSALKTRLIVFKLLRNKKILMSAISQKIHALMGDEKGSSVGAGSKEDDDSKAIVLYDAATPNPANAETAEYVEEEEEEYDDGANYPDLTHSLFDSEDEEDDGLGNGTGSVIDLVRNSKEDASDFNLEDEIDHVADVFIKRFHKQIKLQKLESFKRYREMLERSV